MTGYFIPGTPKPPAAKQCTLHKIMVISIHTISFHIQIVNDSVGPGIRTLIGNCSHESSY